MADSNRRRLTVGQAPDKDSIKGRSDDKTAKLLDILSTRTPLTGEGKVKVLQSTTDAEMKKKRSFAEKDKACIDAAGEIAYKADDAQEKACALNGVFVTCRKGLKPESPNQDSYVIVICPGKWGLYGVFDGHGPNGHLTSDFAVRVLVDLFLNKDYIDQTSASFSEAFVECQKQIEADTAEAKAKATSVAAGGPIDSSSSGSTCTMAFHNMVTDTLTIAHVGDSRGVLYEGTQAFKTEIPAKPEPEQKKAMGELPKGAAKIHYATEDHKPNLPGEKKRIEAKGGRVVFDGYYNYRVFAAKGMYPGLNMSRALGDCVAHKEAGLVAEPELKVIDLKKIREAEGALPLTLIIASDGVWEFINNEDAPGFLTAADKAENLWKPMVINQASVDALAKKSWDSWMNDSDNEISDDITVLAVCL